MRKRQLRAILNKLTPTNFEKLIEQAKATYSNVMDQDCQSDSIGSKDVVTMSGISDQQSAPIPTPDLLEATLKHEGEGAENFDGGLVSFAASVSKDKPSLDLSKGGKFGQRKTTVKITHPDTHEELRQRSAAVQNGSHVQPQFHGASDMPVTIPAAKPAKLPARQRSNRTVPKVSTPQPTSMNSDSAAPRTPIKATGDASKAFSFQFGSISPGFMNGMQVPARTSSASPNLDEQKRDQARHESFRSAPLLPTPSAPQGMTAAPSLQMPMHMPLAMGNPSQVQPSVFVPGLQPHPMQTQGIIHQGQGMSFTTQMGPPQLPPQLSSMGITMSPQQGGKFGQRKTTVKILHPDTYEELRLDKRADSYSDGGSSGPRSHPNVAPQSQPIPSYAPPHSLSFYSPNSYNASPIYYPPQGSVPLTSSQMAPSTQAPRFNYQVGQGPQNMTYMNPALSSLPVNKTGTQMHGVADLPNLEHSRDVNTIISSAPSTTIPVTVKPSAGSIGEKVADSMWPNSSHGVEKSESPKHVGPSGEASSTHPQRDSEICSESSLQQSKHGTESLVSKLLPVVTKQSAVSAVVSSEALLSNPLSSASVSPSEESTVVVPNNEGRRRDILGRSNSMKDHQKKTGKKGHIQSQHQVGSQSTSTSNLHSRALEHSISSNSGVPGAVEAKPALATPTTSEGVSLSRQSLLTVDGATDASELKVESVGEGTTSVSSEIPGPGIIVDTFEAAHHAKLDESSLQNEELLPETVGKDEQEGPSLALLPATLSTMPLPDNKELMMHKAEKKYEVGKVLDEEEAKQRQLRAILNKLTPTNFDKLFEQVKAINIDNAATLTGVVSQIFDRTLMEPIYCEMYVDFCCHLAGELPDFNEDNEKITFKRVLLNNCQWEFERGEREQEEEANKADEESEIKQTAEEREEKRVKARRRMLGNIRLIGELYKKKMLGEQVMHTCIQKFLCEHQAPDGEDVEALCKLMSTIGEMIDHEKVKEIMDIYFERMKTLSNNMNLSSRVRFMLKDAVDLRKNKWQQRRKVEGPKKIEQVHRVTAKERLVQFSRLGHASSKNQSARRAPMDFGPRGSMKLSSPNAQMDGYQRLSNEAGNQELMIKDLTLTNQLLLRKLKRWQWWFFVALNIFFLAVGQSAVVLIKRFYYDRGGNGKWMATLVQTAAFPILFIPLFFISSSQQPSTSLAPPSIKILAFIYFSLGVLISGDNIMYSVGLLYLPASTYSVICVSQLAFNVVFSNFINSQRFTASAINSVVVLSLSAALIAVNDDSEGPSGVSRWKYVVGLLCTLGGSALYSLLHSLMQLSFQKILKRETFSVVLEMQIYTSLVATCVSVLGLFASGEWKSLHGEMEGFGAGRVAYVMTLVSTAVAWQIYSVGVVGLIFVASSLFSNVISTVSFAVTPIAFVIVFHDKMNSIKVIAMLLALWSSVSYICQNYPDDSKTSRTPNDVIESHNGYHKARRTQNDVSATNIQHKESIASPQTPLLMVHKAKKYEVGKVVDEEEAKQRQLRAILNKLTPTKFEKLFEQVKAINIDNAATLTGVVSQIVNRALMEPIYCEMYVNFCCRLARELPDFYEGNEKITFKRVLLNKCQWEFERGEIEQEEANKADEEGEIKESAEEREEKRVKARRQMLGNIRLTGELYKKKMLTERIMHACIQKLLGQYQDPDEEDVEALCKLMSTIGEMIDHEKAKEHMDAYFERMKTLSNNMNLSSRIRFMLKDAIDLRKNKWLQMNKVEGPRKIEEVHKDAAQELQAKKLAGGYRGVLPTHDVWSEESETLSIPLLQRPIGDDSTTLGPQG